MRSETADLGYFGPDSVTWRVFADPASGIGGLRALLLEALHPRAMAGVAEHSVFKTQFWQRLERTGEYLVTVHYGTTGQADRAAARVRGMHRRVRGTDPVTGLAYAAGEPDLLRWVHATAVSSFLDCARRGGLPLSPAEQDRFLTEQVRAAQLVGATDVPADRRQLAAYFAAVRPELQVSPWAREAALRLAVPPMPWRAQPARPLWTSLVGLAFALLPAWARRMYGLPGLLATDVAATVALRAVRRSVLELPDTWWQGPALREALDRAAAVQQPERRPA